MEVEIKWRGEFGGGIYDPLYSWAQKSKIEKLNVNYFYEKITKPTNFTMQECKAKEFLLGIAEHLSETNPKKFGMLLEFTLQGISYLNVLIISHCFNYYFLVWLLKVTSCVVAV